MELNLSDDEVEALRLVLGDYLPNLREEIGKTESYDMRADLQAQEKVLMRLAERLGGAATGNAPDLSAKNPPWGKDGI